jgi:hypothetical protein
MLCGREVGFDAGATILMAMRGLTGFLNHRHQVIADLTDSIATGVDTGAIDAFLGAYSAIQTVSAGIFVAGTLKAGLAFAKGGFARLAQLVRRCNCFVAGTQIETPGGPVPIECLEVGDEVLTRSEGDPSEAPKVGKVTRIFRDVAPAILWLTLATGQVVGVTPDHEVWTHEANWTTAGRLRPGDSFSGLEGLPVEIIEIDLDHTATPIYNLEVNGTFTYFAERVWVHNNSCTWGAFSLTDVKKLDDSFLKRAPAKRGQAPIGKDGNSVQIHHVDQNAEGPFEEILARDHWAIPHDRRSGAGLTADERRLFDNAKERYWKREWDSGRFANLPE